MRNRIEESGRQFHPGLLWPGDPAQMPAAMASAMATPKRIEAIVELGLPIRAFNAMRKAGIIILADAAEWSLRDLMSLPQVGPASLKVLQNSLGRAHLELQPSIPRRRL
jgi:DNA-directed RNA polymerase alpha subunit